MGKFLTKILLSFGSAIFVTGVVYFVGVSQVSATPVLSYNDPGFTENPQNIDRQWGLVKAGFLQAWTKTVGDPKVIVAVIDTGIDQTHADFNQTHFVTGYNVFTKRTIPRHSNSDDNGHGTLIAGVISASANNNEGIVGGAYDASIMPIKALDAEGVGSSKNIADGVIWATDNKASVINLSLGGLGFAHDSNLADAIAYAYSKNVVIVAAAGNDTAITGGNLDKDPVFPVCNDNGRNMVIGVTATDSFDLKPQFANFGKACVDVSAPGRRILSTINHDPINGTPEPNAYAYASGTSLAVPFVSAQAALLRSLYPGATNSQIRNRILSTADPIDNLNISQCGGVSCKGLLGAGRINAGKSLERQIAVIDDGDVVQVEGTLNFYLISGGKRHRISPFVKEQRFKSLDVKTVSLADVETFPEGPYAEPLNGTLVKMPNNDTVYYIKAGLRYPVTAQVFAMRKYKFSDVVTLTNVEVGSWIEASLLTPPDGVLVRGMKNQTVYWVLNNTLHALNAKFYHDRGLDTFPITLYHDSEINNFPKGDSYIQS